VLVTCGGCEAVYIALRTILRPGDEVILLEPAFVLFKPVVELCGATPVVLETSAANGYVPAPDAIGALVTERTVAILINVPGNPTGAVYPREVMLAIVDLCRRRGLWLLADEVYERIVFDTEFANAASLAGTLDFLLAIGSFSKTYSMAGMRVGYLLASAETIARARKVHMYTSNVASTAGQIAACAALEGDQACVAAMRAEYHRRRDRLVELVAGVPQLTGYVPQGAFYLSPALPNRADAADLCLRMLQETGVCTVPGATFGTCSADTFRIAYPVGVEVLEEAFRRITPWLARQSF
jgi:aminotransferase